MQANTSEGVTRWRYLPSTTTSLISTFILGRKRTSSGVPGAKSIRKLRLFGFLFSIALNMTAKRVKNTGEDRSLNPGILQVASMIRGGSGGGISHDLAFPRLSCFFLVHARFLGIFDNLGLVNISALNIVSYRSRARGCETDRLWRAKPRTGVGHLSHSNFPPLAWILCSIVRHQRLCLQRTPNPRVILQILSPFDWHQESLVFRVCQSLFVVRI